MFLRDFLQSVFVAGAVLIEMFWFQSESSNLLISRRGIGTLFLIVPSSESFVVYIYV